MQSDNYWEDEDWLPSPDGEPSHGEWDEQSSHRGSSWIVLLLFFALLFCVASSVLVPGGLGFLAGYGQLEDQNYEMAVQHFQRGLGYLAENYPELAYTEFEIAIRFYPAYEPAREKLREMQNTAAVERTPGAPEEDRVAASLFEEARGLANTKDWDTAIIRLEQLRTLNPDYHPQEVADLLYRVYVEGGKAAVAVRQIELARERFDAALYIQNNDAQVARQRDLAILYLDAQRAVGYDWPTAIGKFQQLYQQDPNYDDVRQRLADAYTQYGDLAAKQGAWCLAVREYDGALGVQKDAQVTSKRMQAMSLCRQAISVTPTAIPAVVGTETYVARITRDLSKPCNTGTGDVSGTVRDAFLQPLAGIPVAYYADGINRITTRTNANGQYQFTWGTDPGLFHVIILSLDGKSEAGVAADVDYPGAGKAGCHVTVDWQKYIK